MFGLSCPQQTSTTPPIQNELPQGTLDALADLLGGGFTIEDGEDCEEALRHTERNSDDHYRFETQCHHAFHCQTWFKTPGCSGVYSVDGMLSLKQIML